MNDLQTQIERAAVLAVTPPAPRRRAALAVAAAYVLAAAFRVALSAARTGPLIVADEVGYMAHARILAGHAPIDLSSATYYYSGSSLFLVPAFWFTEDPESAYQAALVIQALISAAVVPLLYVLCRDLQVSRRLSLSAAFVAAVAADSVFWANYVLSESLLSVLTVAWVWLTVRIVRQGRSRGGLVSAAALGVVLGLMAASHSRGVLLVAVGAVVGLACIRWAGWRNVVMCAVVGAVTTAGGFALNVYTMRQNYPGRSLEGLIPASSGSRNTVVSLVDQLGSTLGQAWYVAAATGIVGLYGLVYVWYRSFFGTGRGPWAVTATITTLACGAITLGSATVLLATTGSMSPDFMVYGRYVSSFIPLLVALGVVGLLHRANRTLWLLRAGTVLVTLALAGVVRYSTAGLDQSLAPRSFPIPTVFTLAKVTAGDTAHVHELRVTAAAVTFFALCCALNAVRRRWAAVGLVGLLVVSFAGISALTVHTVTQRAEEVTYPEGASMNVPAITDATTIAWDTTIAGGAGPNVVTRLNLAYWADDATMLPFDASAGCPAEAGIVAATRTWDGGPCGLELLTLVPSRDIALWQAP